MGDDGSVRIEVWVPHWKLELAEKRLVALSAAIRHNILAAQDSAMEAHRNATTCEGSGPFCCEVAHAVAHVRRVMLELMDGVE